MISLSTGQIGGVALTSGLLPAVEERYSHRMCSLQFIDIHEVHLETLFFINYCCSS